MRVYHVAHPYVGATVAGVVRIGCTTDLNNYVKVLFDRPVSLSFPHPNRPRRDWFCHTTVLFKTSKEAVVAAVKKRLGLK